MADDSERERERERERGVFSKLQQSYLKANIFLSTDAVFALNYDYLAN